MKRYLIFKYATYYPSGGWSDFVSSHDTLPEAQTSRQSIHDNHVTTEIVDTESMKVVEREFEDFGIELDPE